MRPFFSKLLKFELRATAQLFLVLFGMGLILQVGLVGIYARKFGVLGISASLSSDPAHWGALGDFLGGILNPTLTLLTFGALIFTLLVQVRQGQIQQNQKDIDSMVQLLIRADDEMAQKFAKGAPWQVRKIPPKPADGGPPYNAPEFLTFQNANLLRLMLKWMHRIIALDPDSPVIGQLCEKHGSYVRKIQDKGWVSAELANFITKHDVSSKHETADIERAL